MCRGSTLPHTPSFRDLVRSLLLPMLLPQWMRGAVSSMADSMLALFALSLGAPAAAVGAIVGAQFIGVTCSVLFVAVAVERAGQRSSIIAGLVINAAAGVASAATPTWSLLVVSRFAMGIGNSAWMVARRTFIASAVPPRMRGRWNSLEGTVGKCFEIVTPAIGGAIATYAGYRVIFWVAAAGTALAAVLVVAVFPRGVAGGAYGVAPAAGGSWPGRPEWVRACAVREWRWLAPTVLASRVSLQANNVLLTLRLVLTFEQSAVVVGGMMGVRNVTAVLGIAAAGFVIDAYGRRACGVPGLLLLAVGIFGTAAAPSVAHLWAIHAVLGVADGLVTTCLQTLESDLAPPESRTLFVALYRVVNSFGNGVGPLLGGAVAHWSIERGCLVAAVLALLGAVVYAGAGDETLTKPQTKPASCAHDTLPAAPANQLDGAELAVLTGEALEEAPLRGWPLPDHHDPRERLVGTGGPVEHPASPALRTAVKPCDRT